MHSGQPRRHRGSFALCLLLSMLLHLALAWALDWLPRGSSERRHHSSARQARHVQVIRTAPKKAAEVAKKQEEADENKDKDKKIAKTSADEAQQRPQEADFIGNHDSVAGGDDDGPQRRSDAPLPSVNGRESEDEIVTFDQERQDGELAHEEKAGETPPSPTAAAPAEPAPATPPQPVAQGTPEGAPLHSDPQGEGKQMPQPAAVATATQKPTPPTPGEGLRLTNLNIGDALTLTPHLPPPAPLGLPEGSEGKPTPPVPPQRPRLAVYDPSLAPHIHQPGLRTYERRTRSTGRFVFGRRPALNVAATPRGRYEAEIYRRIARSWYASCDEHRGDIIPGSITISLRLNKSGGIDSMDLVRRRGASLIQQSFSFGAIRRSALPPMPAEIQRDIIGELYEMILTFNFD